MSPGPVAGIGAMAQGLIVGSFEFEEYRGTVRKTADNDAPVEARFTLVAEGDGLDAAISAPASPPEQNFARTIASRPGNNINPPELARVAQQLAKDVGIESRVIDEKEMKRLGMGGILAVGSGSIGYAASDDRAALPSSRQISPRRSKRQRAIGNQQSEIFRPSSSSARALRLTAAGSPSSPPKRWAR